MNEKVDKVNKINEEYLKSNFGNEICRDRKKLWYETTKVPKANINTISEDIKIKNVQEIIGNILVQNLNSQKLVDNIDLIFTCFVNTNINVIDDKEFSFSFKLISEEKWMHFSKYVAYLGDKKTIDVKYEKDSNPEDISKRINNLIKDILIDTHLLDILMKRESGKIMNSRQLEYMTPKYQKRYIWDSAALSNNYNIQVIIVKNYLSKKQNYTFERSLKKAMDNFAKKLQDTVNFSITIENLYGININNFIETDLTEKKFIPIGSKVEGLMTTIDQQLLPSLSIDPYLKLVLIEHDVDFTFIDENGDDIKGIIAAAWGSFVPLVMEKSLNDVDEYNEKLKHITSFLFGSMKTLLGIHSDLLPVYQKTKIPLSEWEIQKYKFRFFVDKVLSTIHHIKSTNSLIHKVENMEISENIASKMNEAIDLLLEELNKFEKTGIIKLDGIKRAAMLSEFVSSDSSLVSLLYFPSDQKIGVYLPIALPALFPVIISLIKLLKKEKN